MKPKFLKNLFFSIHKKYIIKIIIFISIIISTSCLIYIPSLKNEITNWDDREFFIDSIAVKEFNLVSIFAEPNGGNYYPFTILSLAYDYSRCQSSSSCYHTTSFIFHTLNSLLVFLLIILFFNSSSFFHIKKNEEINSFKIAFLTAVIFTIHPMNVESVAWISARNHPLGAFFQILALITYIHFQNCNKFKWYFITFLFFTLAILSKSSAIVLPLLLLGLDYLELKHSLIKINNSKKFWRKKIIEKTLFIPPAILVFWSTTLSRKITQAPTPEIFLMSFYEHLTWAIKALVFYISHLLIPRGLSSYYDIRQVKIDNIDWVINIFLIYFIYSKRKNILVILGFVFFLINILPSLKLISFGEYSIFNDRYVYFASIGIFVAILAGICEKKHENNWKKTLFSLMFIATTICYTLLAKQRTIIWKNSEALWLSVLKTYPKTSIALNNLGRVYLERDQLDLAKIQFLKALEDRPGLALSHYNLGLINKRQNNINAAIEHYQKAITLNPNYPEAYNNLGSIQKNPNEALHSFKKSILSGANFPEAYFNLSLTYYQLKQFKEALTVLNLMNKRWPMENRGQRLYQEIQKNISNN